MSVVAEPYGTFRVEDLENPGVPEKFVEIIEGELVVMTPAGQFHNRIGYRFQRLFDTYCEDRLNLNFGGDNEGFVLKRDPDLLLSPDASLFRRRDHEPNPWMEFAPEICVEILSPSNSPSEIAYKRSRYFEFGADQVWIVDPDEKSIDFYFQDGRRVTVRGEETVRGEGLAEGMRIDLVPLFKPA